MPLLVRPDAVFTAVDVAHGPGAYKKHAAAARRATTTMAAQEALYTELGSNPCPLANATTVHVHTQYTVAVEGTAHGVVSTD